MLDKVKRFFNAQGWHFQEVPGESILFLGMEGKYGRFQCIMDIKEEMNWLLFFSVCDLKCPEERRKDVSELLTRLNNGRVLGNFEMDFEDGTIKYKTGIDYEDMQLGLKAIENIVMSNIVTMDTCLPAIAAVIQNSEEPVEATKLIVESSL
jgi:hypothetical protein